MQYILLSLSVFIIGCASQYKQPLKSEPNFSMEIVHKGEFPSATAVFIFSDKSCKKESNLGQIADVGKAYGVGEEPITSLIKLESKIYLSFRGWTNGSGGYWENGNFVTYVRQRCTNLVVFNPIEGKNYTGYQLVSPRNECKVVLLDKKSGDNIDTLRHLPTSESCSALIGF